ncbi:hypothetical protein, partial [Azospirillum sp. TSO5]|uniref:hypothetical protein n=1 Tax=Azospirillum sp. TSO5 TaxID=716760 RepID=UPI001B3BC4AD
ALDDLQDQDQKGKDLFHPSSPSRVAGAAGPPPPNHTNAAVAHKRIQYNRSHPAATIRADGRHERAAP